jgi:exodeoxyribonuclease VII large subunit
MAESAREDLRDQARRLQDAVADLLADRRRELLDAVHRLRHGSRQRLRDEGARLAQAARDIQSAARLRIADARSELKATAVRIANGATRRVERANNRLEQQTTRQRLLDPKRILQRGFALVRGADGAVLPAAERLRPGAGITIQFRDGRASATVDDVTKDTP